MDSKQERSKTVVSHLVLQAPARRPHQISDWQSALRSADRGSVRQLYDLFDNLMLDGVLADAIDKRIDAVLNAEISFYSSDGAEEETVVSMVIDTGAFEQLVRTIMMARIYGRSGVELSMAEEGLRTYAIPPKYIRLEREEITPDLSSPERGIKYAGHPDLIILGRPLDYGLMIKACPYAIYKRGGFGDWSQWIELFGMPQRIGKYNTMDEESRRVLVKCMTEMGSSPWLVAPKETDIEVVDSKMGSGVAYNDFRRALNEEILVTILGQTLTTVSGERGARSLGEVHRAVEEAKNRSDIRYVVRVLNSRLLPWLERRGISGVRGGYFGVPQSTEPLTVAELVQLSSVLPIPQSYIREKYGLPAPDASEPVAGAKEEPKETPEEEPEEPEEPDEPKKRRRRGRRKLSFFAHALTSAQGLLKQWTTSTALLADDKVGLDGMSLIEEAVRRVYGGETEAALGPLFEVNDKPLQAGLDVAFEGADASLGGFVQDFRYNTSVFSAFKSHAEVGALEAALRDECGRLRSFRKYEQAVAPIIGKYSREWLRTEYNTAVRAADSARYYREALRTKRIFPNLEYVESLASDKREEHKAWVGTVLPIEHPWWDTHMPPSAWNCKCSVRKTRRAVTPVPAEGPDEEAMPSTLRQNPGKTASPLKLSEHPYLKGQGLPTCPECRRQGLVSSAELIDEEGELCPMHRMAKEAADLKALVEERRRLYDRLRRDPDYTDVAFDPKTGGLRATHVRHNFDKKGGTGEKRAQEIGFQAGNAVLLLEEDSTLLGIKTVDGLWNGEKMEIATSLRGSANSIVRGLSHCASKPGASVAVIVTMKTPEENVVSRALARFKGLKKSNPQQWKSFTKIVIIDAEKAQMISVVPQ